LDSKSITVLLAADRGLLRGALVSLLSREHDIQVVSALPCDEQLAQVAVQLRPDVVVVDVGVDAPVASGLATVTDLRKRLPACRMVALTAARPAGLVRSLFTADVLGVVDRNASAARLLEAIRGVARGEPVVDVHLAIAALAAKPSPLTPRELDVLRVAAEGASGPEIAKQLNLSPGTVRNYLSKVINKTGARTMTDAVRIARESGWI
jgi:two-component system response regulator DesR